MENNTKSSTAGELGPAAEIHCKQLPLFDCTDLASVRRAFHSAASCSFQQAWLPESEAGFCPGEVRLGWRESSLMVLAELTDQDIFNRATRLNQLAWELGDVFELFFKLEAVEQYFEFQVTPENQRLQLAHPEVHPVEWANQPGELEKYLLWGEKFHSQTWVEGEANRWVVYAEIPSETVCGSHCPLGNTRWRYSFGRYDYTRGLAAPVISSTSPHRQPNFHRRHEWGVLIFEDSAVISNQ